MSHVLAKLDRRALLHNLAVVRENCPKQKIWAMVKADGYGHGLQWVVDVLKDVDAFGVATLEEALQVKTDKPVVIMRGFLDARELQQMHQHGMVAVVHCWQQLMLLQQMKWLCRDTSHDEKALAKPVLIWIKIDTGMHRLGFAPEDIPRLTAILPELPVEVIGWMTHLAQADDLNSDMTEQQVQLFYDSVPAGVQTSIANSAAILAHPATHADWVRPGLMLYGVSPFADKTAAQLNLKPVMSLEAPVLSLKFLQPGQGIGYGLTWRASEQTQVATVGIGYGDGYPREAAGASLVIHGQAYPVVGRVSMDMLAIDLGPASVQIGDFACAWGASNPVEQLATVVATIPYTLLTRVSKRVELKEVDDE